MRHCTAEGREREAWTETAASAWEGDRGEGDRPPVSGTWVGRQGGPGWTRPQRDPRNGLNETVFVVMSRADPNWEFSIRIRSYRLASERDDQ